MLYAIVAVISLILDQAVKYWTTVKVVVNTGKKTLIPGVIHIANVHNFGAAFSILRGARWLFVALCLIFTAVVIYALYKRIISTPVARWASIFVLSGAIGNCIDRIICGYVVDMFEFEFIGFPVFNVADIYITLGAIVFCLCVLLEREPGRSKKPEPAPVQAGEAVPVRESAEAAPVTLASPAPAGEEAQPVKRAPRPRSRRRTKLEIPDFPKHEPVAQPDFDPSDPFAEWERRANSAPAAEQIAEEKTAYSQPAHIEYTQPTPVSPKPQAGTQEEPSFDLDDILAEFKDL